MARVYSPGAAALACLALAVGIAAVLVLTVRHGSTPRPAPIKADALVTWSHEPRSP